MIYNKKIERYKAHLKKFIESHNLFKFKKIYVALSGGKDSMAMLTLLNELNFSLVALHVNHGTRPENLAEELGVSDYCRKLNIPLQVKRLNLSKNQKNFEATAREKRYQFFNEMVPKDAHLVTAHTIDDSFEWSLLSSFKSGSINSVLGIPLVRGNIIRPFHSFTRRMVEEVVHELSIPYFDDPTNLTLTYERNYIRHQLIPKIRERFPTYLKHFVERNNRLAHQRGVHQIKTDSSFLIDRFEYGSEIWWKGELNRLSLKELLRLEIRRYSISGRGEISRELDKLFDAIGNHREGPMNFSGGVKIYMSKRTLLITNRKLETYFKKADLLLSQKIKGAQIPEVQHAFPRWSFLKNKSFKEGRRRTHPLWPLTVLACKEEGIAILFNNSGHHNIEQQ